MFIMHKKNNCCLFISYLFSNLYIGEILLLCVLCGIISNLQLLPQHDISTKMSSTLPSLDAIGLRYIPDFKIGQGKTYKGGDKTSLGKGFAKLYDCRLHERRQDSRNVVLLELGVMTGRSLAMWCDYFDQGIIYGVDVDLTPFHNARAGLQKLGAFQRDNLHVLEYNVCSKVFATWVNTQLPPLDVVVDDALHQSNQQLANLILLFPKLKKGGLYIVEDLMPGYLEVFNELLRCVGTPHDKTTTQSKYAQVARLISYVEIYSHVMFLHKK
jgi:hypothetical protein